MRPHANEKQIEDLFGPLDQNSSWSEFMTELHRYKNVHFKKFVTFGEVATEQPSGGYAYSILVEGKRHFSVHVVGDEIQKFYGPRSVADSCKHLFISVGSLLQKPKI